ncbi:unnamed protein product [Cylindrotheca closterium]|uniref:Uncharacterized protein n=1 Tax=Cylindrotheca closterium TaxID=2856 RepID=A0AAD2JL67_9STRA|nr:unnamed protein product [Cylindrotheca closterium]
MNLLGEYVQLLSRVTETPAAQLRQKACLLGILRSTFHLGCSNRNCHDDICIQGDVPWLKSIYEGDDLGEGIVKHLRKLVPHGLCGSTWQVPVLTKFYKGEAMEFVESLVSPEPVTGEEAVNQFVGPTSIERGRPRVCNSHGPQIWMMGKLLEKVGVEQLILSEVFWEY